MTGGVVSLTVTLKDAEELLPAASFAVQVTVAVAYRNVEPEAGEQFTGSVPSTASVAVGFAYVTTAPMDDVPLTMTSAGTPLITGAVVSLTVTVNDALELLPRVSCAVQWTVVMPSANREPDAGAQLTVAASSGSEDVTAYDTVAPPAPEASAARFPGFVIVGAVMSATVTLNDAEELLPAASVAVQLTVVGPYGNVEPEAGKQFTGSVPSTASVAVGFV
jgi:hypothetical protein